jgi:hypothetical protein
MLLIHLLLVALSSVAVLDLVCSAVRRLAVES